MSKAVTLNYKSFIKKMTDKKRICALLICEAVIIFSIHIFNINRLYGFFLSEDELGYWGNAAFFLGKDWGNTVSYCGYYSFGYSFFLMLIMSLPVKALTMYRIAIAANALFMSVSFLISYYLFTRLFSEESKTFISIACMAMALYSSYIAQSSVAWSECYLILFTWLILLQGYLVCKKVTIVRTLVFAVELGYTYMIHQRTVPFLIAGVLLIILLAWKKKAAPGHLIAMVITVAVMLYLSIVLKGHLKSQIYSSGKIANEFSTVMRGMHLSNLVVPVIRAAAGQIYYLWTSSFGIIPLGIGAVIADCIKKCKERNIAGYFQGFVILAFLGLLGVSSIFVRLGVKRIDYLIYGRYLESITGYFVIIGFLTLPKFVKQKKSLAVFAISSAGYVLLALLLLNKILSWNVPLVEYQGVCAAGTFWFYSMKEFSVMELCAIVLLIQILIFFAIRALSDKKWVITMGIFFVTAFWIAAGLTVINEQISTYQGADNRSLAAKDSLWKYMEEHSSTVVFLTNTRYNARGSLQLYMGNTPLFVVSDLEELDYLPDILIVDNDDSIIANSELNKYHFVCYAGRKNVYSLEEISLDNLEELPPEMFVYHRMGPEEAGYVMFGPYIRLEPGTYEVTFQMNISTDGQDILGMMDVVSDGGNVICSLEWDGAAQSVSMRFHLEERVNNVEFRYFKNTGNDTIPIKVMLSAHQ